MLDIGLPAHPWQASVKGNPEMVVSLTSDPEGMVKAPANGRYFVGDDGIPHKARKGDLIPADAKFEGGGGATADAPTEEVPAPTDEPTKVKSGKRGPSETTDAVGPTETT